MLVGGAERLLRRVDPVGELTAAPERPAGCLVQFGLNSGQVPAPFGLVLTDPAALGVELLELLAGGVVLGEFLLGALASPGSCVVGLVGLVLLRTPGVLPSLEAGLLEGGVGGVLRSAGRERGFEHPDGVLLRCGLVRTVVWFRTGVTWWALLAGGSGSVSVVVLVVGGWVGGDVGVVPGPAAGHRDVEVFPVHPGSDEHDPDVGARALGTVDGGRPAVLAVLRQVIGRQDGAAAAGEVLHDQPGLPRRAGPGAARSWSEDPEPVTVADVRIAERQLPVVAAGPQEVPGLPLPPARDDDRPGELAVGDRGGTRPGVQSVHVLPGPGEHQHVQAVGFRGAPVGEHAVQGAVTVRAGMQAALSLVGG